MLSTAPFLLSGLLYPLYYWTQSVLQHIPPLSVLMCLASSHVPILLNFIFTSPSYSLLFLLWHKKVAMVFDTCVIHVDDYNGATLW